MTTFTYDANGCATCGRGGDYSLTQVTDAKWQSTSYAYDLAGRLLTETDALGNVVAHTYDANGRRLSTADATDPPGTTSQYRYDALGRLRRKQFPDQTTADFTYDAYNNLFTARNAQIAYTFRYDRRHRLTEVSDSRGLTLRSTYDALGRRTQLTSPDTTAVAYDYDAANRLVGLSHGASAFAFTYDRVGRRTQAAFANGTTATSAYNRTDDLLALTHKTATGTVLQRTAYTYNSVGNRTAKVDQLGDYDYTYDALHRLQEATTPLPSQPLEAFTYDLLGNRLDSTENGVGVFNAANQLLDDADFTYLYNPNGTLRRKTAKVGGETTQYVYDVEHQLVRVVLPSGTTVRYAYDALGRRIRKAVTDGTTTVTQYVYDHEDIVQERNGANALIARYTHGPGIDEPLMLVRGGQRYVYHTDGLGSITALTDAAGVVRQRYTYTAFGTIASQLDANFVQPYTFTGREWEKETGLYYYRARYYDPMVGRFISKDPIGLVGGLNTYAYVSENPVSKIDPFGLLENFMMELNSQPMSSLECGCGDSYPAFSGNPPYRNDLDATTQANIGPSPEGWYYIVDRPTGGAGGRVTSFFNGRDKWFALYRDDGTPGDDTVEKGVTRREMRLHPKGRRGNSFGCVTLNNQADYDHLRKRLLNTNTGIIPGTNMPYYGMILLYRPSGGM